MANQDQTHNGPTNLQTIGSIRYPTPISPARPPVLMQQIMADFQLSQEPWNKLSSQMNEKAKTKKLLKKAVKSTPKQYSKKAPNQLKTSKKIDKTVKYVDNLNKDSK